MKSKSYDLGGATLHAGDCVAILPTLGPVDAIVTDPPYGLEFMGKDWDAPWQAGTGFSKPGIGDRETPWPSFTSGNDEFGGANPTCADCGGRARGARKCFCVAPDWRVKGRKPDPNYARHRQMRGYQDWSFAWATEAYRVLKPGGYLLAFGGTRTHHRLWCAIEDAGFVIQDTIMWLYGCLSEDTQLVTKHGVTPYHKANVGDPVLCYDPAVKEYSWQPIQEIYEYDIDDTVFRIRSDRTDQIVSRNHRCLVERGGTEIFEFAEALASECTARVPVLEDLPGLLEAFSGTDGRAGESESDVFASLQWSVDQCGQERKAESRAEHSLRDVQEDGSSRTITSSPFIGRVLQSILSVSSACRAPRALRRERKGKIATWNRFRRLAQSSMERWCDLSAAARELCFGSLCPLSSRIVGHGTQGWLRDGASAGRGARHRATAYASRDGASRQPQTFGQSAYQFNVVCDEPRPQTVRAWRGHQTDLARITPEHYRGKIWCIRVATGCFLAVRNGKAFPTGNSGFPKGRTQLKPAHEPICVAYKPGGKRELQIDECRIETDWNSDPTRRGWQGGKTDNTFLPGQGAHRPVIGDKPFDGSRGRWPANVCHSGDDEVMEAFAEQSARTGMHSAGHARAEPYGGAFIKSDIGFTFGAGRKGFRVGDRGTAARFFYCAKASKADRADSKHPTVKPIALMRWLVRLVTPPGGTVLDPFAGSGTTGAAAIAEGRNAILIEREPEYIGDIRRRLKPHKAAA